MSLQLPRKVGQAAARAVRRQAAIRSTEHAVTGRLRGCCRERKSSAWAGRVSDICRTRYHKMARSSDPRTPRDLRTTLFCAPCLGSAMACFLLLGWRPRTPVLPNVGTSHCTEADRSRFLPLATSPACAIWLSRVAQALVWPTEAFASLLHSTR